VREKPDYSAYSLFPYSSEVPDGPDVLFGSYQTATKEDLIACIPLRHVADRLVAEYFRNKAIAPSKMTYPQV
jgi:hypothetical protein